MTTRIPLSDVLRKAADEHLWPTPDGPRNRSSSLCSCDAVFYAARHMDLRGVAVVDDHYAPLLTACGQDPDDFLFDGPESQNERFMFLEFAALYADDEGLFVDVEG